MNLENNEIDYDCFVLNDQRECPPKNKIYTMKYLSLLTTLIILVCTQQLEFKIRDVPDILSLIVIKFVPLGIAFTISILSTPIGHLKLTLITFVSSQILFLLFALDVSYKDHPIMLSLKIIFRRVSFTQIIIQVFATWPHQFSRIFIEFSLITTVITIALNLVNQTLYQYIILGTSVFNILLILRYVKNFRSPETDSLKQDFVRLIFNRKMFTFFILIGSSYTLILFLLIYINIQQEISINGIADIITLIILAITLLIIIFFFAHSNYQVTLIFAISIALLLFVGLLVLIAGFSKFQFQSLKLCMCFFLLLVFLIVQFYAVPQTQKVLLNIGIRNLDFSSAQQFLLYGLNESTYRYILNNKLIFEDNILVLIISSLTLGIFILAFIFYQILDFQQYFIQTKRNQIEENEFYVIEAQ